MCFEFYKIDERSFCLLLICDGFVGENLSSRLKMHKAVGDSFGEYDMNEAEFRTPIRKIFEWWSMKRGVGRCRVIDYLDNRSYYTDIRISSWY